MNHQKQKWPDNLVIVRHGESQRNEWKKEAKERGEFEYGRGIRNPDVGLTERGADQCRQTGKYLAERLQFDVVYTSPYCRTRQTTQLLIEGFPRPLEVRADERLREKEFGILDGLTTSGRKAHFPAEAIRSGKQGKYYYRPPGGENYPDVNLRVHSFLGTLARDWRNKSVLVVCHSVIVVSFRLLLERITEEQFLAADADPGKEVQNCSVTWYGFDAATGTSGKLVEKEVNEIHYSLEPSSAEPPRTSSLP